jgi:hypothetical protein
MTGSIAAEIDTSVYEGRHQTAAEGVTLAVNFKNLPAQTGPKIHPVIYHDDHAQAARWLDQIHVWTKVNNAVNDAIAEINTELREAAKFTGKTSVEQLKVATLETDTEETQTVYGTMDSLGVHRPSDYQLMKRGATNAAGDDDEACGDEPSV